METEATSEGMEHRLAQSVPIPAMAVWGSLTEAQQEHVRRIIVQVCREWLREGVRDEPA